jgi:hypothetical protein
MFWL